MVSASLLTERKRVKVGSYDMDIRRSAIHDRDMVVVLIHGIGVSGDYFLPFANILAQSYDVRLLDMPGYGKTPHPDHALSVIELADIVGSYLAESGVTQAIVVGQSMGCQVAARLALRHPSRCKKLILIGPTVNKWERSLPRQAVRLFQDMLHEPVHANLIVLKDYLRMGALRYLRTSQCMLDDHLEEYLSEVHIPVLVVRGSEDTIAPRHWADHLAATTKLAEVAEIRDAPHVVQFVKPKELFAVCRKFLKS